MKKAYNYLSFATISVGIVFYVFASVLPWLAPDAQGCNLSPDNVGCLLNRPIDIERRLEKASP